MSDRRRPGFSSVLSARSSRLQQISLVDVMVALAVLVGLYLVAKVGQGTTVSFTAAENRGISTDPANLPYYAARSLLRMFVALGASFLFTFVYASVAAKSRRAEKVLIPALDILQSVPVLGFLSITVTAFIALAPGSLLGLEMASVFAIFTSQVWNLTFSFYHSLITLPQDLDALSRVMRLSRWQRFWRIEVPNGTIGLVWNGMMSMGGGWFFLVASEAITVLNRKYSLPGVGAYAGAAIAAGSLGQVALAVLAMVIMVVGVNFLFWSPLVAWSEKFKNELSESDEISRSMVLNLLRSSSWPRVLGRLRRRVAIPVNRIGDRLFGVDEVQLGEPGDGRRTGDVVFAVVMSALVGWGTWSLYRFITVVDGPAIFWTPLWQGAVTLARVVVLVIGATLVWIPIGVRIGMNPKLGRIAQPIVQILASFPANFLFPFATYVFIHTGLGLDVGGVVLMSLGAQWYILFNTIAGAMAIPSDLREAMDDLGVTGWLRWRHLILPGIFPYYVTGGITASGGAWNASIVAEIVTYGGTTLTATGLGAYIAHATEVGNMQQTLAGVSVMSLYVVALNRLFWQRLYRLAERRFSL
ncbi:MAG: ABC transporter permease subunit [Microthrixaceae bacterium]